MALVGRVEPVFPLEAGYALELACVVGDEGCIVRQGGGGDQCVQGANLEPLAFEFHLDAGRRDGEKSVLASSAKMA